MLYAADLGLDQVEIVEEPLGGRGEELAAMDVIGQDAVGVAQNPRVLVHPREELLAAVIAGSLEREAGGEPPRALLQTLDAQELGAERAFSAAALPGTEEATQGAGHELPSPRCTNNSRRGIEYAHFTQVIHRRSHDAPMAAVSLQREAHADTEFPCPDIRRLEPASALQEPGVERAPGQAKTSGDE